MDLPDIGPCTHISGGKISASERVRSDIFPFSGCVNEYISTRINTDMRNPFIFSRTEENQVSLLEVRSFDGYAALKLLS